MFLRQAYIEEEDNLTKRLIQKLQQKRDSGEITEDQYEEQYETAMQDFRLRFAQIMDNASFLAYKTYKNQPWQE